MKPGDPQPSNDKPIEIEPDDPNEVMDDHTIYRRKPAKARPVAIPEPPSNGTPTRNGHGSMQGQAFQWALDAMHEPAMASADWLARDIDPNHPTAVALLGNPEITLAQVKQAKAVFKTMRIVGEKAADRRIGARMYAVAIAVALVRFGERISTQSDEALGRGFEGVLDDRKMPEELRSLAGQALSILAEIKNRKNFGDSGRSA